MNTRTPMVITDPIIAFVSFEGVDHTAYILTQWLKAEVATQQEAYVHEQVQDVLNALQALMNDTDVIMLKDN